MSFSYEKCFSQDNDVLLKKTINVESYSCANGFLLSCFIRLISAAVKSLKEEFSIALCYHQLSQYEAVVKGLRRDYVLFGQLRHRRWYQERREHSYANNDVKRACSGMPRTGREVSRHV